MSASTDRLVVLCVDDENVVLRSLRDQLRHAFSDGISVELAESGEEGLEVLDELVAAGQSLALVLSDQLMPGMRGEAFLAEVHRRAPEALTVLLTGQATADAVGRAVNEAQLYRYIAKPWEEADLALTVRGALSSYQQAREIELQEAEARRIHEASLRFVPKEFLSLLGRERMWDVRFGDHVVRPMHLLFSDMRGYTNLVESKPAAEAFAFVNEYLQRMEEPIRVLGGFVCNVEGDAVLALFPASADDAVRAGIATHRAIEAFNVDRGRNGEAPVHMGVGVHSGPLLLGTVGGEDRLQCNVVGDSVNLASRVESLTKSYGTRMLVTGATGAELRLPIELRHVDRVQVKGKTDAIDLYEALDALEPHIRDRRLRSRERFEAAGAHLRAGELDLALAAAGDVLRVDPEDRAAVVLASRCQDYQQQGLPRGWDGVERLVHK